MLSFESKKEILKNKEEHEFVITTFPEQNQKVVRAGSEEAIGYYKKLIANMIMSNNFAFGGINTSLIFKRV